VRPGVGLRDGGTQAVVSACAEGRTARVDRVATQVVVAAGLSMGGRDGEQGGDGGGAKG
jgi:hypothetical protein